MQINLAKLSCPNLNYLYFKFVERYLLVFKAFGVHFSNYGLLVALFGKIDFSLSLWSKNGCIQVPVSILIIYKQQFLHSDWLRACQLIPNQCKKVKLSAKS